MELSPEALKALCRIRLDKRWISSTPQPVLVELVRDWLAYRRLIGPPQKRPSKPSSLDENKAKRQTTERDVTELFLEIINGYDEEEARDEMLALPEDELKEGWKLMMERLLGPTNNYLPMLGTMFDSMLSPTHPPSFTLEIEGQPENPDPSEFLVDILWSYYSNVSMKHMEINHFTDELYSTLTSRWSEASPEFHCLVIPVFEYFRLHNEDDECCEEPSPTSLVNSKISGYTISIFTAQSVCWLQFSETKQYCYIAKRDENDNTAYIKMNIDFQQDNSQGYYGFAIKPVGKFRLGIIKHQDYVENSVVKRINFFCDLDNPTRFPDGFLQMLRIEKKTEMNDGASTSPKFTKVVFLRNASNIDELEYHQFPESGAWHDPASIKFLTSGITENAAQPASS